MYIGRECPFQAGTLVPMGQPFECRSMKCRFQIDNRCAIIAGYYQGIINERKLDAIMKALHLKER